MGVETIGRIMEKRQSNKTITTLKASENLESLKRVNNGGDEFPDTERSRVTFRQKKGDVV
jgi:hypothetical protein